MESLLKDATTLRNILASHDGLNLWEVRAILSGNRDSAQQALRWMAARKEIVCGRKEQGLFVTLAETRREGARA